MIYGLGERQPVVSKQAGFIAPNACIIGSVRLSAGVSVWFSVVIRGDNEWITIGENSNVQDGAILHTDPGIELVVGRHVTVGHRAMLHGCNVGDNSLIGIGSTLLNHSQVGKNSVVGAHALIPEGKVYPDGVLLLGAPARIARELDDDEIGRLQQSAAAYTRQSERYLSELVTTD